MFLVDTGKEVYVWVGSGASTDEKRNAMTYAHVRYELLVCMSLSCFLFCLELPDENKASFSSSKLYEGGI